MEDTFSLRFLEEYTHTQALTLSFLLAHTHRDPEGTAVVLGETPPVGLYKRFSNLIDRSCMDQVTGVECGYDGGEKRV